MDLFVSYLNRGEIDHLLWQPALFVYFDYFSFVRLLRCKLLKVSQWRRFIE